MITHNLCVCGEIRNISIFFWLKKASYLNLCIQKNISLILSKETCFGYSFGCLNVFFFIHKKNVQVVSNVYPQKMLNLNYFIEAMLISTHKHSFFFFVFFFLSFNKCW